MQLFTHPANFNKFFIMNTITQSQQRPTRWMAHIPLPLSLSPSPDVAPRSSFWKMPVLFATYHQACWWHVQLRQPVKDRTEEKRKKKHQNNSINTNLSSLEIRVSTYSSAKLKKRTYMYDSLQFPVEMNTRGSKTDNFYSFSHEVWFTGTVWIIFSQLLAEWYVMTSKQF